MYSKGMRKGKMNEIEKPHSSSQDVVEPNCDFLTENVFLVWRNRTLGVRCLVDTYSLLLEHNSCIFILHCQLGRCVLFIDWLPVRSELICLTDKPFRSQ